MTRSPRLYVTTEEATALRTARDARARIRRNVIASADELSTLPVRRRWIAPIADDPDYENLYDRFYAVMTDAAVLEQLAFAAVISGRGDLAAAARRWLLGIARAWSPERDIAPDYGTAYAITRLMKALAVGWELLRGHLSPSERRVVRSLILDLAAAHWSGWFGQPVSADSSAHTHHAHVEWSSFGVTALAMLDETADARTWVDAATEKFRRDLLPHGVAVDGAQLEGASFWASTTTARFFFLDPLRRITGIDLAAETRDAFRPDISLAAIAGPRRRRMEWEGESVLLEPDYAQLGYHAPALLALARLHRDPHLQALAAWDPWLGRLHDPGHRLPSGEQFRMCLGPYALLWYDPTVAPQLGDPRHAFQFQSVNEAYLRQGWEPGGIVVAAKAGRLAVHAGGRPVLVDLTPSRILDPEASVAAGTAVWTWDPPDLEMTIHEVVGRPAGGVIRASAGAKTLTVELRGDRLRIERNDGTTRSWWAAAGARRTGRRWDWNTRDAQTSLTVETGSVASWQARGYVVDRRVGYGNLRVQGLADRRRALTVVEPDAGGRLVVDVRVSRRR